MTALIVLHAVVGLALFPSGRRLGRRAFLVAALVPAATLVWALINTSRVVDGEVLTEHRPWVAQLGLAVDLRLDGFALVMVLLVAGIGVAVFVYSATYFSAAGRSAAGIGRTAGLLVMFAGAMLTVVLADNLIVLYAGWELTSITSYLLIGNDHTRLHARAAALHALLVTSMGGLTMLAGFVLVGQAAGTYRLSAILDHPPTGAPVVVGVMLVLVGAFTKSAQYPFHSWLPGAMAAPTPVSAYLHSATMVKAGIYLVGRFAPVFAATPGWRPVVMTVGLVTMVAGGLRALRQRDLKLLLAFGTVSQLGLLMVLFGVGTDDAAAAGCVMLVAHAMFKAALFMTVGTVDRRFGTRIIGEVPRLRPGWGPFAVATVVVGASMAGFPLALGFIGKEAALDALHDARFAGHGVVVATVVVGSALTVAYACRFLWGMFLAGPRSGPQGVRPGGGALAPIAVLAGFSLVLGVAPSIVDGLISTAVRSLDPTAGAEHLALWHGINVPLIESLGALLAGVLLFVAGDTTERVLATGAWIPSGTSAYLGVLRATNRVATLVTGIVQNGSLPVYAGVVLLTAAVLPGAVWLADGQWPGLPRFADGGGQVAVVAVLIAAAVAAAAARRRFSAALFLGTVGYSMAALFVVQGAPDLALTQVAIETLSTVLFVLVLRRLPDRFERTSTPGRRTLRVVVSALVGVAVLAFGIVARDARTAEPVSTEMIARAYPDGHGRNVVNVILVDIRGLDTMGEISVLACAAIGAVALARVGRRRRGPPTAPSGGSGGSAS